MKHIDVKDLMNKTSVILDSLEKEDVVLTKDGKPVAILKKFDNLDEKKFHKEVFKELLKSDGKSASQYSAMLKVWGDPHCDAYDEAFMDD
jgi:hypothetical protein